MLLIYAPIAEVPWYLVAAGLLTAETFQYVRAAIQAARQGLSFCPVLDLSQIERAAESAGEKLAEMVEQGEVSLFGAHPALFSLQPRMMAVINESRLEATEALMALVQRRRHDGVPDGPVISDLLDRMRAAR